MTKWYHIVMGSLRRLYKTLRLKFIFKLILFFLALLILIFSAYNLVFWGRIFPNISVTGVPVSDLGPSASSRLLSEKVNIPEKIRLVNQGQSYDLLTKDIGLSYTFASTSNKAFNLVRTGNIINDLVSRTKLLLYPINLTLDTSLDELKLQKFISVVSGQVSQDPINSSIKLVNGVVVVNKGTPGTEVDQNLLQAKIVEELTWAKSNDIQIPISVIDNSLNDFEAAAVETHAKKFIGKKVVANFEYSNFTLSDQEIIDILNPRGGFNDQKINATLDKIGKLVNRNSQNPKFTFDGGRVTEFQPALDGITLDWEKSKEKLVDSLNQIENSEAKTTSFDIPVNRTPPEITTDKVNNLGIKELIGRGTSTYFHSIPGRVHNVSLATSRINGTLIKPGDTFSFNATLGDVSAFTGYQQAYIISGGKTILGDGGGVCQVSTTLFRSILNAGLPVVERAAHAYRVGYYEQDSAPGLDATVYSPSPDLKFTNDTPGYILIEAAANPKNYSLVFELYGTSDGRTATISKPVISNVTAPPDDLYQDDPTLPTGNTKQIDFKAWGAKVVFNYSVARGGEQVYQKTFVSSYRPWQAVYLRGTGPVQ